MRTLRRRLPVPFAALAAPVLLAAALVCNGSVERAAAEPPRPPEEPKQWRFGGPSRDTVSGDVLMRIRDGAGPAREVPRVRLDLVEGSKVRTLFEGPPGEEGRVLVPSVEPGRVVAAATIVGLRRAVVADVVAGRTTEIDLFLPRGGAVEGEVRHAESGPLAGVRVALHDYSSKDGADDSLTTRTDEQGRYRFEEVPARRWAVSFSGGSLGPVDRVRASLLAPGAGNTTRDFVLGLVNFRGTVRDGSTGRPVAGVRLEFRDLPLRGSTSEQGEFAFEDVPAGGPYTLFVSVDGYGDEFLRTDVVPGPGAKPLVTTIVLRPSPTLVVTLRDRAGRPVAGSFWLDFRVKDSAVSTTTQVSADERGICTHRRAPSGACRVGVRMDGWSAEPQDVVLKPGVNALRFVLSKAGGT